ncbi:MAG: 16S rRNA (cytosine(1402)-N(4))-methyltransferase RsmH [bacterium]|nr:16S rRNA (cytosine(1402)-N(4))-methyltransferase RsmH [bacterium]
MKHIPVLMAEVIKFLQIKESMRVIDATCGAGGHSHEFVKLVGESGQVFAFEKDEKSFEALLEYLPEAKLFNKSYTEMSVIPKPVDAILFDLGVSSMQLDEAERGFSFRKDGALDMRFSKKQTKTAAEIVNNYSFLDLRRIVKQYGEEKKAAKIARRICDARAKQKISTTLELEKIIYMPNYSDRKHPATRTFQALRIETNSELLTVERGIEIGIRMLKSGGRLGVISFHSLEDRVVKNKLKEFLGSCSCPKNLPICVCGKKAEIRVLTKKPIYPSSLEVKTNRRARSAIFRVIEKL